MSVMISLTDFGRLQWRGDPSSCGQEAAGDPESMAAAVLPGQEVGGRGRAPIVAGTSAVSGTAPSRV